MSSNARFSDHTILTLLAGLTSSTIDVSAVEANPINTQPNLDRLRAFATNFLPSGATPELLASVTDILSPWVDASDEQGKPALSGVFTFQAAIDTLRFQSALSSGMIEQDIYHASIVTALGGPNGSTYSLTILFNDKGELTNKCIAFAHWLSYRYLKITDRGESYYDSWYFSNFLKPNDVQPLDNPQRLDTGLAKARSPINNAFFIFDQGDTAQSGTVDTEGSTSKRIRLGVAKLGKWSHEIYGTVEFTQQDFDQLIQNFNSNELGYEPFLTIGHHIETQSFGGVKSDGFLVSMFQDGDILYTDWDVLTDELYADVAKGHYRYCSGEFFRELTSKISGEPIGTALHACALTNSPFVPGLPQAQALTSKNPSQWAHSGREVVISWELTNPSVLPATQAGQRPQRQSHSSTPSSDPNMTTNTLADQIRLELDGLKAAYKQDLDDLKESLSSTETKLAIATEETKRLSGELAASQEKVAALQDQIQETKVAEQLSQLASMGLPEATTAKYSALIKEGNLQPEQLSAIFDLLSSVGEVAKSDVVSPTALSQLTRQHGQVTSNSGSAPDPYEALYPKKKVSSIEERLASLIQGLQAP